MTPTFCWVFLLALVGRAASMPQPLVVDACALICNPGAETEAERERDETLYPRYPKVNCQLQSQAEEQQAWVIVSQCLKLCNQELSTTAEANCFALRSSLGANLGCYCEALTPLSPNTMRLHESWRLNFLVKELANDIITTISQSPLDMLVICEIHNEMLSGEVTRPTGEVFKSCFSNDTSSEGGKSKRSLPRTARRVEDWKDEALNGPMMEQLMKLKDEEGLLDIEDKIRKEGDNDYTKEEGIKKKREVEKDEALNNTPSKKLVESEDGKDKDQNMEEGIKKKLETEKEKVETKTETKKEANVETNMKTSTETNMETNTKTNTETNTKTKTETNTETKTETSTKTNTETNTKDKNECLKRNVGENREEKELCEKNNAEGGDNCEKCRLGSV